MVDRELMEYLRGQLERAESLQGKIENLEEALKKADAYRSSVEIHVLGAPPLSVRVSKTEVPLILTIIERELEKARNKLVWV